MVFTDRFGKIKLFKGTVSEGLRNIICARCRGDINSVGGA